MFENEATSVLWVNCRRKSFGEIADTIIRCYSAAQSELVIVHKEIHFKMETQSLNTIVIS